MLCFDALEGRCDGSTFRPHIAQGAVFRVGADLMQRASGRARDRRRCGNGTVELGEACDDGNEDSTGACTTACALARCGDGTLRADLEPIDEAYEGCDDGNTSDDDACLTTCVPARCGDGVVRRDRGEGEEAFEACDDGNAMDDDACLNTCVVAFCGDGVIQRP